MSTSRHRSNFSGKIELADERLTGPDSPIRTWWTLVGEPFSVNEHESDDWHFSNIDNAVARLQIVQRYLKTQCDDQFVNARLSRGRTAINRRACAEISTKGR
jgi:hypothetical protein